MMNYRVKKLIAASVITACVFAGPYSGMANAQKPENKGNSGKAEVKVKIEKIKEEKQQNKEEKEQKRKNHDIAEKEEAKKLWQEKKDVLEAEKDVIEAEKDQLEAEKEALEKQAEEAKESGNLELYQQLKAKIDETKEEIRIRKEEMKQIKVQMKELVRNRYSQEELDELQAAATAIQAENPNIIILPVENIVTKKGNIKFDTPPVIKEGRTLIPVRALMQGFGAEVEWNPEEKKVTVTKGDVEIVFQLADGKVFVNGEEKEIDVPAQVMNHRTIVPLRFIAENFGLEVEYDPETEIIEVDEEEETTTEEEDVAADDMVETTDSEDETVSDDGQAVDELQE